MICFPFASFWQENDISERQKLKLIDAEGARKSWNSAAR